MSVPRPRTLLVDDHPMVLEGLRRLLEPELEVVAMVTDSRELLAVAESLQPDLIITDVTMPGLDGIEATRQLQAALPGVKILVLSIHAEPSWVRAAFAAGAWGYLHKSSAAEEIEGAVREVLAGRFYVSPALAQCLVGASRPEGPLPSAGILTAREKEILHLLAEALSNKEIARRLGVKVTTVRTHLNSLYEKLHLESRVELALYAAQTGGVVA